MSQDRYPITPSGYERAAKELEQLKTVERPSVIVEISEARAHGDLSENAEYHAALEKQGFIEAKIKKLEWMVGCALVIDPKELSGDTVKFGATVELFDEESEKKVHFAIVSEYEADIESSFISHTSPLAKAIIGKKVGETVEVAAAGSIISYYIESVSYV
ncbi:Transcription elongation factor GreA [Candidatus Cyrtobacter comes]|uniref:Transcription elongation factor GreA n=1 Tax=Candidatus Cyrtobacter comes TaxID=675776 RepID=A0ABU5L866_9RICK|nr:transcription elongation factor GreA [Candidatus Cyrtobacter comes]MDZ5762314.1 Transcription elongation factor GreA [Candidatus Cyrtobacter comes]